MLKVLDVGQDKFREVVHGEKEKQNDVYSILSFGIQRIFQDKAFSSFH